MTWIRRPVTVSGQATLNIEIRGTGPALFFLHGIGGRARQWRDVVDMLDQPACSIIWDARGYGDSRGAVASAFGEFADDLVAVLDELQIERALCVGHSMGGRILIEAASKYADRFAALFLSGAPARYLSHLGSDDRQHYVESRMSMFDGGSVSEHKAHQVARQVLPKSASSDLIDELAEDLMALRKEGYAAALSVSTGWDRSADAAGFKMPCEVLGGALDAICPPSSVLSLGEITGAEKVTVLDGVAHMAQLEAPGIVAALVSDFVSGNGHLASRMHAAASQAA